MNKASSADNCLENVKVYIRMRPLKDNENILNAKEVIDLDQNVITVKSSRNEKSFQFWKIFDGSSSQMDLYRIVAVPIVEKVLNGYNGTIFAYGQSGTGKTYTMTGDTADANKKGIIPNIFSHIFAQISVASKDVSYTVTVTFLEIYNEEVRDLLSDDPTKKLTVLEKPELGVYVKDLLGFTVTSLEEIMEILTRGDKNRVTGATKINDLSSRSHAIFTILIETKDTFNKKSTHGKLNLVDLAGSERVNKTQATGDRLREAGKINLSLSVLGNVISALIDGKSKHIPYRNSKLTRLLQDSLGGNSLTAMIATISPCSWDVEETMYTLMYADRVRHIKNPVSVNTAKQSLIDKFESKIAELKQHLESLTNNSTKTRKSGKRKIKKCPSSEQLDRVEMEKQILENKIRCIQDKILVGGENLIEKAQQQLDLLEDTAKELKHLDSSHQLLEEILFYKEKEKNIVERRYVSLQEEDRELDKRIEEAEKALSKAQEIMMRKENEYQNEIGSLLHTNKNLAKEMKFVNFIVNHNIPREYMNKIKSQMIWNEESQEWQLKGIAYCGNNLRNKYKCKYITARSNSQNQK